jgi:hypothetical protein
VRRGRSVLPVDEKLDFQKGDLLTLAVVREGRAEVLSWLASQGWEMAEGGGRGGALPTPQAVEAGAGRAGGRLGAGPGPAPRPSDE